MRSKTGDVHSACQTEIERLRAALEHIATHEHDGCNAWQGIVAHDRNVAKKALGND